MQYTLV